MANDPNALAELQTGEVLQRTLTGNFNPNLFALLDELAERLWGIFMRSRLFADRSMYNYILNQEKHHNKQTFQEEYIDFLKKFETKHEVKYLFEWIE